MPQYFDQLGVALLWRQINNKFKDYSSKLDYYSDTKNGWDSKRFLISEKDVLYIYKDYKTVISDDNRQIFVPGLKIGDGTTFLIDLPFINDTSSELQEVLMDHINNNNIHVSLEEKSFWNNKLNLFFQQNEENLVLNRL